MKIVTDNAQVLNSANFIMFCHKFNITVGHSTTYCPQGNGLTESSNKKVVRILKKTIAESQRNWDSQLKFSLWANRFASKISMGKCPFKFFYGKVTIFPIQLAMPVAKILQDVEEEPNSLTRMINQLVEL